MKYKFIKDYFVSADADVVQIAGNTVNCCFDSQFSQKVLSNLYVLGKPYVVFEDENEIKVENTNKIEKIIIDEPKKTIKYKKGTKSYKKKS
jgi:hypothetical protein